MALIEDYPNLVAMFHGRAEEKSDGPCLWAKRDGTYEALRWSEVADQVRRLASALVALGLEPGERVVLVSENRPEWCIADLAVMMAGGVTVPTYTTNTQDDHAYVLSHSDASIAICSSAQLARRLLPAMAEVGHMRAFIHIDPLDGQEAPVAKQLSWEEAMKLGSDPAAGDRSHGIERDDLACFIYTSGTGGRPKGVMLSHRNIMTNVDGAYDVLRGVGMGEDEIFLSFLPLSHSYEHTAGQFLPLAIGAQIYYAEGVETLSTNFVEARPTIITCVPRLYEVLRQRISHGVRRAGGFKQRMFQRALDLGSKRYEAGGRLPLHEALLDFGLDRLVRSNVKERFGGRLKAMVSGGAPLNYDVGLFFMALGLPVLQGYGQTEAAPVISVNLPGDARLDTVGPPLKGVEVKIAEDGELLVRGGCVMKGYWKDPEETARTVRDGWLHTGDVGALDGDGRLRITDRKKDIIVNSGGDNISPQRIEGMLVAREEIAQALVYGDRKPYLVALIVPHSDFLKSFAREHGKSADPHELCRDEAFEQAIDDAIGAVNKSLSPIERVRRFALLPEPFTIDGGYLTPTLKLRRQLIIRDHKEQLEGLYGGR